MKSREEGGEVMKKDRIKKEINKVFDEELELAPLEHTGDSTMARKVVRIGVIRKRIKKIIDEL